MNAEDQKLVDNVMDWFDFSRMAKMMESCNFGWVADCEEFSESILREFVRDKIIDAHGRFIQSGREYGFCETGGIVETGRRVEHSGKFWDEAVFCEWCLERREKMKPDWKDAPEWAEYLAMDCDGTWFWYEEEPTCVSSGAWFWVDESRFAEAPGTFEDWQETLEKRPK